MRDNASSAEPGRFRRPSGADLEAALDAAELPPLDDDFERDIAEAVGMVTSAEQNRSPRRRRFVSREKFAEGSLDAPDLDLDAFRADQDAMAEQSFEQPATMWRI